MCYFCVFLDRKNGVFEFVVCVFKVYEILDNAVDEAQAGFASKIDVVLHEDDSVSIVDNGRGVRSCL